MTTLDNNNICYNKNINNIFDNIENRVQLFEKSLNQFDENNKIEFKSDIMSIIDENLLNEKQAKLNLERAERAEQLKDEIEELREEIIEFKKIIEKISEKTINLKNKILNLEAYFY
jgi:hypothetical protein